MSIAKGYNVDIIVNYFLWEGVNRCNPKLANLSRFDKAVECYKKFTELLQFEMIKGGISYLPPGGGAITTINEKDLDVVKSILNQYCCFELNDYEIVYRW